MAQEIEDIKKKPLTYDVRIINCFVSGVGEVMEFYFGSSAKVCSPSIKKDLKASGFVSSIIAFTGQKIMGSISLTFDKKFIEIFAAKLLEGQEIKLDEVMICDVAGEACNQVLGKTKISVEKLGLRMSIGLPKIVIGEGHSVYHNTQNPVLTIPVNILDAKCVVEFTMSQLDEIEEQVEEEKNEAAPTDIGLW